MMDSDVGTATTQPRGAMCSPSNRGHRGRGGQTIKLGFGLGVIGVLGLAARAAALTIDGGPVYAGTAGTPASGVVCSTSLVDATHGPSQGGGAVVTCSLVDLGAAHFLYFGIRNDQF